MRRGEGEPMPTPGNTGHHPTMLYRLSWQMKRGASEEDGPTIVTQWPREARNVSARDRCDHDGLSDRLANLVGNQGNQRMREQLSVNRPGIPPPGCPMGKERVLRRRIVSTRQRRSVPTSRPELLKRASNCPVAVVEGRSMMVLRLQPAI